MAVSELVYAGSRSWFIAKFVIVNCELVIGPVTNMNNKKIRRAPLLFVLFKQKSLTCPHLLCPKYIEILLAVCRVLGKLSSVQEVPCELL